VEAPPHGVKFLLTTRVAPQALLRTQPALQRTLELEKGLASPYAEEILKSMDADGTLGLHDPEAPLNAAREATRGYPRALEAIVGILRTDRSTTLPGVLVELQQLQPKAGDVVQVLVGEAFNRLDPTAQEVMQALAVYGAPVPAVAVDYLLQPYRVGIDSARVLGRLVGMQFVRGEAGRYYLHQVDRDYALSRIPEGEPEDRAAEPPPFTRYALRHRAAEYFKETRKPREAWKTLDDMAPQLAEFDLRCAGRDWNTAASALTDLDEYLYLWGHYRLSIDRHERLRGKLTDAVLEALSTNMLGLAYGRIGEYEQSLRCREDALALARAQGDRPGEAVYLGNMGSAYDDLGDHFQAIAYYEQALAICQEIGDKRGEAIWRGGLAASSGNLGRTKEAIAHYEAALAIHKEVENRADECRDSFNVATEYAQLGEGVRARALAEEARKLARAIGYRLVEAAATSLLVDIKMREGRWAEAIEGYEETRALGDNLNDVQVQMGTRLGLSRALLHLGDLPRARAVAEEAAKYRYPSRYPNVLALRGIVAARQGDQAAAAEKLFAQTLGEAERLLAGQARPYSAAYAKALALAGLALCRDAGLATTAAAAYRDARAISAAPGAVADALQDLDALAAADPAGLLQPVRAALAGEA
jgi:tetratricopeptide (TPR) repeat protein